MLNANTIYTYYSSHLLQQSTNTKRYSEKTNDLKTVYKNMVKQTKTSPLYKFRFSDSIQSYAIGIKEAAIALEEESHLLGARKDSVFDELMVTSDNENVIYATLNTNHPEDLPETLSIKVDSLATGQTNVGAYLPSGECSFAAGEYSFGIAVGKKQYTFNLTVRDQDTNYEIQQNLANSINSNAIGVHASLRNNRVDGTCALVLRSDVIGMPNNDDLFFHFDETYLTNDITTKLGIEHIEAKPANANFSINGTPHSSVSNRISLNHSIDLDLLSTSDSPVTVRILPDDEKIADHLNDFLHTYNQLVDFSRNGTAQHGATQLYHDITGIAKRNQNALSTAGISIDENGYLNLNEEVELSDIKSLFDEETSAFRKDIKQTAAKMTLNPLKYIDKTVVTYPNTTGTYPNPYYPSRYSGLLFNDYA